MKKQVITIDGDMCAGTIALGYGHKEEALGAMIDHTGEFPDRDNLEKVRIFVSEKNGDSYYSWGKTVSVLAAVQKGKELLAT